MKTRSFLPISVAILASSLVALLVFCNRHLSKPMRFESMTRQEKLDALDSYMKHMIDDAVKNKSGADAIDAYVGFHSSGNTGLGFDIRKVGSLNIAIDGLEDDGASLFRQCSDFAYWARISEGASRKIIAVFWIKNEPVAYEGHFETEG
jgi:hypothetical protein